MKLVELAAALSLATDLGTGQPLEHGLRTCVLADRSAEALGLDAAARATVRYATLLRFLGCTSDAAATAALVGDEIAFNAAMAPVVMGEAREALPRVLTQVAKDAPLPTRVGRVAAVLRDPGGKARTLRSHCEVGSRLAARLGLGPDVIDALAQAYERWDGKGLPTGAAGEAIPLAVRIAVVARDVDVLGRDDWDAAEAVLRQRRGRAYDPTVTDLFLAHGPEWLAELEGLDPWDDVTAAAPADEVPADRLAEVLSAFADFVDLKSPWFIGHSRAVADLAAAAASPDARPAALVHDLGIVAVSSSVWDHAGPLTAEARERVRLHPYFTERILGRCGGMSDIAAAASAHHERLDGSGYFRGDTQVGELAQIIAAADVYAALRAERPQRPALAPGEAADALAAEADDGRLARSAVDAVLGAAGHAPPPPDVRRPAGLTEREVDVLRLIARGRSNKEVGAALGISAKTVGTHVEHIYAKAGVSTRAGATLFAMEQRLLTPS